MTQLDILTNKKNESKTLFLLFSIWSFILLCRPQDYLSFLALLRPSLTLGLITMFIYFLSAKNSAKISSSNQFRLYRYLIMVMIIGVPFSYYRSASLMDVFNYASINTMFFFLFYKLVNTIAKLRSLLFAYCSGVAIYAIYILKFGNFSDSRISFGTMFDPNDIAFYIISFLTFNLLFITKDNKGYKRIISIINIMIGLIVILKTGSRGGLIALITVFAYLLFAKTRTVKLSFMTKGALVLIAIVSLLFVNMNSDRYKTILDLQNDYNVTDETGRIAIWKIGTRLMLSHPFTGIGMNRFSEGVGRDREERGFHAAEWQAPHNSLVQIGAETGIFGLILFCLMSSNAFKITGQIIGKSRSEELVKISEMARAGFIGLFLSAMFISQAYSVYWVFYIVLSAVMKYMLDNEAKSMQNNYG
jgi:O-antigen ligase